MYGLKEDYWLFYEELDGEMNYELENLCKDKGMSSNDVLMKLNTSCKLKCRQKAPVYQYQLFLSRIVKVNFFKSVDRHVKECTSVCVFME